MVLRLFAIAILALTGAIGYFAVDRQLDDLESLRVEEKLVKEIVKTLKKPQRDQAQVRASFDHYFNMAAEANSAGDRELARVAAIRAWQEGTWLVEYEDRVRVANLCRPLAWAR